MAAQLSDASTTPPIFIITCKLAERAASRPLIQVINEDATGPSMDPRGTPPVTDQPPAGFCAADHNPSSLSVQPSQFSVSIFCKWEVQGILDGQPDHS